MWVCVSVSVWIVCQQHKQTEMCVSEIKIKGRRKLDLAPKSLIVPDAV